jgi:hypothetical protein
MEDQAECMLVLIGATLEGKNELIGFQSGVRESGQIWRELLVEIRWRGLSVAPRIALGDRGSASGSHSTSSFLAPILSAAGCTRWQMFSTWSLTRRSPA